MRGGISVGVPEVPPYQGPLAVGAGHEGGASGGVDGRASGLPQPRPYPQGRLLGRSRGVLSGCVEAAPAQRGSGRRHPNGDPEEWRRAAPCYCPPGVRPQHAGAGLPRAQHVHLRGFSGDATAPQARVLAVGVGHGARRGGERGGVRCGSQRHHQGQSDGGRGHHANRALRQAPPRPRDLDHNRGRGHAACARGDGEARAAMRGRVPSRAPGRRRTAVPLRGVGEGAPPLWGVRGGQGGVPGDPPG
mmetsp:Transcript_22993/g.71620  ORF Transcript_22993/g.71620 Transcript_22993/m.71620 type:complete len:246 (-) Transcript_22993:70-807(-)